MDENQMKKLSFYLPTEILSICDRNLERANVRSRNQFLVKAVKFYDTYLNKEELTEVLTPAFESVIDAKLDLTEYRLSRSLFKLAVEIATEINLLAASFKLDPSQVQSMKHRVINEVKELSGEFDLEKIVKFQNGES